MPGVTNLGSTVPEIAYAVLDAIDREHGGFWKFCENEMGLSTEDLNKIVANIKA
jgi:hypothetical protein